MTYRYRNTLLATLLLMALIPTLTVVGIGIFVFYGQIQERNQEQVDQEVQLFAAELNFQLLTIHQKIDQAQGKGFPAGLTTLKESFNRSPAVEAFIQMDGNLTRWRTASDISEKLPLKLIINNLENTVLEHSRAPESSGDLIQLAWTSAPLAEASAHPEHPEYLLLGKRDTSRDQAKEPTHALLIAINIDALLKQIAAITETDLSTTEIRLNDNRNVLYTSENNLTGSTLLAAGTNLKSLDSRSTPLSLHLYRDKNSNTKTLLMYQPEAIWGLLGLLVVALFLSLWLVKRLMVPITRLNKLSSSAELDTADTSSVGFDEFDAITRNLQALKLECSNYRADSEAIQNTLEQQIEQLKQQQHAENATREQFLNQVQQMSTLITDLQSIESIDELLSSTRTKAASVLPRHRCVLLLNRTAQQGATEHLAALNQKESEQFYENLSQWHAQDFNLRSDTIDDLTWTLIPLHDKGRAVIGQCIFLGPEPEQIERELALILARMVSALVSRINLSRAIERQANTDRLTGLSNRLYFESQFQRLAQKHAEYGNNIGLISVDIDGLQKVNDQYGHDFGDLLIQRVASQLQLVCRESDTLARVGGDEFYILLTDANIDACRQATERLAESCRSLELLIPAADQTVHYPVSFSIGYASSHNTPVAKLSAAADEDMHRNKHA